LGEARNDLEPNYANLIEFLFGVEDCLPNEKSVREIRQSSFSQLTIEKTFTTEDVPGNAVTKPLPNSLRWSKRLATEQNVVVEVALRVDKRSFLLVVI
jgi:hypothetical protein